MSGYSSQYDDSEHSDDYHDCDGSEDCGYMELRYDLTNPYDDDDEDRSSDDTMNGTTQFDERLSNDTRTLRRAIIERPARINTRSVTRPRRSTRAIKEREFLTVEETPKKSRVARPKDSSKLSQKSGIMVILNEMAEMLINGEPIDEIAEYLRSYLDDYRDKFTKGEPDRECSFASKTSIEKDTPAKNYKDKHERILLRDNNNTTIDEKELMRNSAKKILALRPKVKIFNYAKSEGKQVKIEFDATVKGYCGDCWLCGLNVYFYANREYVTSCGQCEHIGGIIASILTGMLTSSLKYESVYNYGSSHVHCNQKKSDTISMKFDKRTNRWVTDDSGVNDMVKDILFSDIHSMEYDPEFIDSFESLTESKMKTRIKRYTKIWCQHANTIITHAGSSKINISKKILNIIKYTYNKVQHKFDIIPGGGPDSEDSEVFNLIDLKGFEIDSNINDENVEDILNELRENPLFYELLNNLIKAINETLIENYDFTPEMLDELSYSNETEYPMTEYATTEYATTDYAAAEYPRIEYATTEYPRTEYPMTEYPRTEYPRTEYPTNDFYKKYKPINNFFDFPREDFNSNNLISTYGGKQKNRKTNMNRKSLKKIRQTKKQNNKRRTKRKAK